MNTSAPAPDCHCSDGTLWLAYRLARDQDHSAAVRFRGVVGYAWGVSPASHLADLTTELPRGSFYEIPGAVKDKVDRAARRWLVTFPDALLEVQGAEPEVVLRATASRRPTHSPRY